MNASDRHFPRESMSLHPAQGVLALKQHHFVDEIKSWPRVL